MRALAVLLSLVLAFGAAVMIVAAGEISDTPTLEEIESGEKPVPADNTYYDGSATSRSITTALGYASGIIGGIGVVLGFAFAITGRRGRLFAQVALVAIVLAGIALII
ncbi:MAG: hypothetical protein ABI726_05040 [bacterium]